MMALVDYMGSLENFELVSLMLIAHLGPVMAYNCVASVLFVCRFYGAVFSQFFGVNFFSLKDRGSKKVKVGWLSSSEEKSKAKTAQKTRK